MSSPPPEWRFKSLESDGDGDGEIATNPARCRSVTNNRAAARVPRHPPILAHNSFQ
jgi:hypothetical protein